MDKTFPLSVCMISGAEASRIRRALESVRWASDIVVVINEGVSDGTAEIAASFGARVFFEPWKGFIGQKNSAARKARESWILNLDADEEVPEDLAEEIRRTVRSPDPLHAAYEFPRCTFYCGHWIRHGDWYPDRVLRLYRQGKAEWAGREPHAKLKVQGTVGRLKSDLRHYTDESIEHQIGKIIPYTDPFVQEQAANGWTPSLVHVGLRPLWRFLRAYILRGGFLDGWQGCYIAWVSAFSVATKYARTREAGRR